MAVAVVNQMVQTLFCTQLLLRAVVAVEVMQTGSLAVLAVAVDNRFGLVAQEQLTKVMQAVTVQQHEVAVVVVQVLLVVTQLLQVLVVLVAQVRPTQLLVQQ